MKLAEIIEAARAADPAAFGDTNDKRAIKILRASLRQVHSQLVSTKEGEVVVGGFGRFVIKNIGGQKDGVTKRRVIFRRGGAKKKRRAAEPKAKSV